jgi:hypothetical protein
MSNEFLIKIKLNILNENFNFNEEIIWDILDKNLT